LIEIDQRPSIPKRMPLVCVRAGSSTCTLCPELVATSNLHPRSPMVVGAAPPRWTRSCLAPGLATFRPRLPSLYL